MLKKRLFVLIGFLAFGIGSVGVILPILPTTPFLLLSAYCFARGSEKFHVWLKQTKVYQMYVADYLETRTVTRKKKWKILLNIYLLMGFSIYVVPLFPVKILLGLLTAFQTVFLFFFIDEPESDGSKNQNSSTDRYRE